jgi:hypothetical protein
MVTLSSAAFQLPLSRAQLAAFIFALDDNDIANAI